MTMVLRQMDPKWTPRFDWYRAQRGSQTKDHKDTCSKKLDYIFSY